MNKKCLVEKLIKNGKIRKQPAGIVQVEALLRQAMMDLSEARKISHIAERATYVLAYMAMLKAGRALLLMHGLAPTDGAQHKTVVDLTSALLAENFHDVTLTFDVMRRKRNEMTYEAGALITLSEAQHAFDDAICLVKEILRVGKNENPQLALTDDDLR